MTVVVALGGNALLRRGESMSSETQRGNVRTPCERLAPIAARDDLEDKFAAGSTALPTPASQPMSTGSSTRTTDQVNPRTAGVRT